MSGGAPGELKHLWLRRQLQDLARGLKPGEALPGERHLEEMYGVSRITVRRAISDLVQDGELVREKGKGTFVTHGMVRSVLHLASFNEDMRAAGFEPSTRVITADLVDPPAAAATHLRLRKVERAYRLRRLRLANGTPVSVDESWLPAALLPNLLAEDLTGSLYRVLSASGQTVRWVQQTVQASAATAEVAHLLEIAEGAPVLLFHRRSFSGPEEPGTPIEYSTSTYRSDRYQVSMTLTS